MKPIQFSLCFLLILSGLVQARTFHARIDHIDRATKTGEHDLVMFSDGSVGVLRDTNKSLAALPIQVPMKITTDKNHNITSMTALPKQAEEPTQEDGLMSVEPAHLKSINDANSIFANMNRHYQDDSQCYNRAHIWTYEEYRRTGTALGKVFIFFTNRYIRNYNYDWWFHAIPVTYVGGSIVTLDRRYARGPLPLQTWSNIFVRSHRVCPIISSYSQYNNNQNSEDCYIHPATMYFWQPYDLDRYERTGYQKTSYIMSEVNAAYNEAF